MMTFIFTKNPELETLDKFIRKKSAKILKSIKPKNDVSPNGTLA